MAHRDGVAAVDRALDVLEAVEQAGHALTLGEIAQRTGLIKSTVLRLAANWLRRGYLRRGKDGSYQLGPTLARLGASYQSSFQLADHILPVLNDLTRTTGESSSFYVRHDDIRTCLFRVNSEQHMLLHFARVGTPFPYHTGASGRIIRAFSDPPDDADDEVRRTLFATSIGSRTLSGSAAVAAPVFGVGGEFIGAVSLVAPSTRFSKRSLPQLRQKILEGARRITESIGGPYQRFDVTSVRSQTGT
jgi:DNA-binding IclR family transcriptional regulator